MGIVVPETCWSYKKYNKITSGIWLVFILNLSQRCTVRQMSDNISFFIILKSRGSLVSIRTMEFNNNRYVFLTNNWKHGHSTRRDVKHCTNFSVQMLNILFCVLL